MGIKLRAEFGVKLFLLKLQAPAGTEQPSGKGAETQKQQQPTKREAGKGAPQEAPIREVRPEIAAAMTAHPTWQYLDVRTEGAWGRQWGWWGSWPLIVNFPS